ncbi:hydantoinase B/oxoprolinase family protein [Actinomadura sp. SCN-SB]|uniref:hydantoinase B/oxoprolinase family protein n=1 Tax=Actinomadura sp. SCN-SB TaxID=3373092 RepID=UPI003751A591
MTRNTAPAVDAITVEVVSQSLAGIVQEMQNSLFCTGYSTIIRESRDASCAILDPAGRVLSQFTVLPLHLGAFPACVEGLLSFYSADELSDGDAYLVNHPYWGGSPHAPDMAILSPIVIDGGLFGFSASIAHKSDIGGLVPGSSSGQAREIFHEGLMVPPVRFSHRGEPVREVETILRANSRTPDLVIGDLQGQVGATRLGAERVRDLCAKHGTSTVASAAERLYLLTERRARAAIATWPDGSYEGYAALHSEGLEGGRPVAVRVTVTIDGDQATFGFSASDDQVGGPYNIRPPLVRAVCSYALKCLVDPELPSNHGLTLAVETVTRDGSVLSPVMPAPVNTYMPIANVVAEAIFDALGPVLPRARIGESSRGVSGTLSHILPGEPYPRVQYELPAGAVGARADADGVSASKAHVANGTITPVEILESEFPVELVRFELVPDSGGAGRFRGGLAYVREYRMLGDGQFSSRGGHLLTPPAGREGGLPGGGGATIVNPGRADERHVSAQDGNVRLHAGDVLRREMSGAGGYGDPREREVERVLDDVRNGYVTPESARSAYGVVVVRAGHTWDVDAEATAALRAG